MAEHTPTPWTYEAKGGMGSWIAGSNKEWSALSCGNKHETADANAEFIVRAVNSHDALVKALEQIALIENQEFGNDWEEIEQARNIAQAALASAHSQEG